MPPRHPKRMPKLWLMTDERIGDALWPALEGLPRGSGVIFRHYVTERTARRAMFNAVAKLARRRHLVLILAGKDRFVGADGLHGSGPIRSGQIRTWPTHSRREAIAGIRAGADLLFVSPVFTTRSHIGQPALGPLRARTIAAGLGARVIALGGMNPKRFRRLKGFHGWAAIDALTP